MIFVTLVRKPLPMASDLGCSRRILLCRLAIVKFSATPKSDALIRKQ